MTKGGISAVTTSCSRFPLEDAYNKHLYFFVTSLKGSRGLFVFQHQVVTRTVVFLVGITGEYGTSLRATVEIVSVAPLPVNYFKLCGF